MRCAICGHPITSEIPSPLGGNPAYECWREGHVVSAPLGRPTILVPGPHEQGSELGEQQLIPCPTCRSPARAMSNGPYPIYRCAGSNTHFFAFADDCSVIDKQLDEVTSVGGRHEQE